MDEAKKCLNCLCKFCVAVSPNDSLAIAKLIWPQLYFNPQTLDFLHRTATLPPNWQHLIDFMLSDGKSSPVTDSS